MRVVYYAVEDIVVGASTRHPGDLIPEASAWPYLQFYVTQGRIAPVLVATLPEAMQDKLAAWEEAQSHPDIEPEVVPDTDVVEEVPAVEPEPEEPTVEEVLAPKGKSGRRREIAS